MRLDAIRPASRSWFCGFIGFTLACATLGLVANPYRLLPIYVTVPGINDIQPALYRFLGPLRLFDLSNRQFGTLLFGSSRVVYGLDPQSPELKKYREAYNAGLFGPQLFEIEKMFDHALANQKNLRQVVLGLDFFAFNTAVDNKPMPLMQDYGKSSRELIDKYSKLAVDVRAIADTLFSSAFRKHVKSMRLDGMGAPDPLSAPEVYPEIFARPAREPGAAPVIGPYSGFGLSNRSVEALQHVIDECKKRNIELRLFVTPTLFHYRDQVPAAEWTAFRRLNIWSEIQRVRAQLARMHPYWDFNYPNSVTENPKFFINAGHFSRAAGELILARILASSADLQADFGLYVDEGNIQQHLARMDRMFDEWNAANRPTTAFTQ